MKEIGRDRYNELSFRLVECMSSFMNQLYCSHRYGDKATKGIVCGTTARHQSARLSAQVARDLLIDIYRRERLFQCSYLAEDKWQRLADNTPTPEAIVCDRQRLAIFESALLELREKTRRVFAMHLLTRRPLRLHRSWIFRYRGCGRRVYLHARPNADHARLVRCCLCRNAFRITR